MPSQAPYSQVWRLACGHLRGASFCPPQLSPLHSGGWGRRPAAEGSFRKLRLQVKSRQNPLRGRGEPVQGGQSPVTPPPTGSSSGKTGGEGLAPPVLRPHSPGQSVTQHLGETLIAFPSSVSFDGSLPGEKGRHLSPTFSVPMPSLGSTHPNSASLSWGAPGPHGGHRSPSHFTQGGSWREAGGAQACGELSAWPERWGLSLQSFNCRYKKVLRERGILEK